MPIAPLLAWLAENGLMLGTIGAFAVSKYLGTNKEDLALEHQQIMDEARIRAKRKIRYGLEDEQELRRPLEEQIGAISDQMGLSSAQDATAEGFQYESPELMSEMMFPADLTGMEDQGMAPDMGLADSPEVQAILSHQGTDAMSNKLIQSALASGRPSTSLESLGFLV